MATKIIKAQITQRRDTLANWASVNPVLLPGELGFVTDDVNRYKIGDGVHAWNDLPFRGFDGALVQNLGDSTTAAISQKAVTDELKKKVDTEKLATINGQRIDEGGNIEIEIEGEEFDKEGNYPSLHVGTADTAIDLAGRGESVPASFGFRASGGKSIKDGRAYIKRIKGNSVVWNQHLKWRGNDNVYNGLTVTYEDGKIHVQGTPEKSAMIFYSLFYDDSSKIGFITGHYYLIAGNSEHFSLSTYNNVSVSGSNCITQKTGDIMRLMLKVENLAIGQEVNESFFAQVIDLTQMFQAGNEPTTIEDFNARVATLGIDMYAYNEGQVIHCNTESIKSVGDNAWDEQWDVGTITEAGGIDYPSASYSRTRGYVKVIGGEQYVITSPSQKIVYLYYYDGNKNYIFHKYVNATLNGDIVTIPSNCQYMRFTFSGTTYNHDICIRLAHTGYKTDYEPYWQDTLPLPIIRKYFPDGMKKAGSAHDEIRYNKASGKWEYSKGKIKSVDLGTLNWSEFSSYECYSANMPSDYKEGSLAQAVGICSRYIVVSQYEFVNNRKDKDISGNNNQVVFIRDTSYTDAVTFKAAMSGVMLYYESNDWEWVELDEADQNFRDYYNVADFGTEQSQSSVPSAAFSADIIYQFNAVDMIREHELEITELQKAIATMQAQLTSLINGGQ